jgi:hypothetical protein
VEKVLSRFGYKESKPSPTPYDLSLIFRKNKRIGRDELRYSHIIRSLMYLASVTRPDISFVVSKLSHFNSNPGDDHWHALERVMHYLAGTVDYRIHYSGYPAVLEGYSDANWIYDMNEWISFHSWWCCCFMEVIQTDNLNEVYHGGRTRST